MNIYRHQLLKPDTYDALNLNCYEYSQLKITTLSKESYKNINLFYACSIYKKQTRTLKRIRKQAPIITVFTILSSGP